MNKVYTKNQMQISAFFLGPLGAFYFLKKNFELLGNQQRAKSIIQYGILAIFALCLITPLINTSGISLAINIGILLYIGMVFEKEQIELVHKEAYSNWKVLGISLIGLFALLTMNFVIIFVYIMFGIIKD